MIEVQCDILRRIRKRKERKKKTLRLGLVVISRRVQVVELTVT